ncbi:MAG: hypothetical protein JW846_01925 [Dehalococcoidia bacterium]|nr:hypothetical protein [Dehalococcoidia bacterium]
MNKGVKIGLGVAVGVVAILVGVSLFGESGAESYENAEEYVEKDVNAYIDAALDNDHVRLEDRYGKSLAGLGETIYLNYQIDGQRARIVAIERSTDECWATVEGAYVAMASNTTHDSCTFLYTYKNGRWQLAVIRVETYSEGSQLAEFEWRRDIPFK